MEEDNKGTQSYRCHACTVNRYINKKSSETTSEDFKDNISATTTLKKASSPASSPSKASAIFLPSHRGSALYYSRKAYSRQ